MLAPADWIELAKVFGVPIVVAAFILVAGATRWWVFGWTYKQEQADKVYWRKAFMRLAKLTKFSEIAEED